MILPAKNLPLNLAIASSAASWVPNFTETTPSGCLWNGIFYTVRVPLKWHILHRQGASEMAYFNGVIKFPARYPFQAAPSSTWFGTTVHCTVYMQYTVYSTCSMHKFRYTVYTIQCLDWLALSQYSLASQSEQLFLHHKEGFSWQDRAFRTQIWCHL